MGTGRTVIGDNVIVPILVDAVSAAFQNNPSIFVQSGAMIQALDFPLDLIRAAQVEVPTFARMPGASFVNDGQPTVPHKLTSSGEFADIKRAAIAFSLTDRARASQLGTYEESGRQCMISLSELWDDFALSLIRAASWMKSVDVFSAAIGSAPRYKYESYIIWPQSIAAWLQGSPDSEDERVAAVEANVVYLRQYGIVHPYARRPAKKTEGIVKVLSNASNFNGTAINLGRQLLGEAGWNEAPAMICVHSDVVTKMAESRNAAGDFDLIEKGPPGPDGRPMYFNVKPWGIPLLVTDKLNKTLVP
jgi:hypothetical protein